MCSCAACQLSHSCHSYRLCGGASAWRHRGVRRGTAVVAAGATRRYAGCSLAWPVLVCRTVSIVKSRPASIRGSAGCSTQLTTYRAGDGHLSTRGLPVVAKRSSSAPATSTRLPARARSAVTAVLWWKVEGGRWIV